MATTAVVAGASALSALTEFDRALVSFGSHYTRVARQLGSMLRGSGQPDQGRAQLRAVATLGLERDNLLKTFDWVLVSEDGPAMLAVFSCLAEFLDITSDFLLLRSCARSVRAWAKDNGATVLELAANLAMAHLRWRNGNYAAAREVVLAAGALLPGLDEPGLSERCWLLQAELDLTQGRSNAARGLATEVLAACRGRADRQGEAHTLDLLARIEMAARDYPQAEGLFAEALAVARTCGDCRGEASALDNLGVAARHEGRLDEAHELHSAALAIREGLADRNGMAACLNNLGLVERQRADYPGARETLLRALALAAELADRPGQAKVLVNLGQVELQAGGSELAEEYLRQALALCRSLGDREREAQVWGSLASVMLQLSCLPHAARFAALSLAHSRQPGAEVELVEACFRGAAVLIACGQVREAALALHSTRPWAAFYQTSDTLTEDARRTEEQLATAVATGLLDSQEYAQLCLAAGALTLSELANTVQGMLERLAEPSRA